MVSVLKASPRRRLGVHAPSTDLRLARLGARLARLGVQPPHLARRPPYRLENNGHILDMDNAVSSELLGHECEVFYNICFSFSVLHCCQTCNIRTCDEGRTEISDRVPGNSNWRHEQVSCLFPQAMHLWWIMASTSCISILLILKKCSYFSTGVICFFTAKQITLH